MHALKLGKELADAEVTASLYQKAIGYSCKETKIATTEKANQTKRNTLRITRLVLYLLSIGSITDNQLSGVKKLKLNMVAILMELYKKYK